MALFPRSNGEAEGARPGPWRRLRQFVAETWSELKKTTWPDRKEVYGTTVVVIVAVIITGAFLLVVDKALESGLHWIFTAFGK